MCPNVAILYFSPKNVCMISYTLYFFYNNSLVQGHENLRTSFFEVIDFDPEKIERKGCARFLWRFSIFCHLVCYKSFMITGIFMMQKVITQV